MGGMSARIRFLDSRFHPVDVQGGACLSEVLDLHNSPVLFGCRTGLCGTCAAVIRGDLPAPSTDELEVLDAVVPGVDGARLLCQLHAPRQEPPVEWVIGPVVGTP